MWKFAEEYISFNEEKMRHLGLFLCVVTYTNVILLGLSADKVKPL